MCRRRALDLPVNEPGRYVDENLLGKGRYDPTSPLYRYDYWGEPKNSEKSKQERKTEDHNRSIVGKAKLWYDMPYEQAIKQQQNPMNAKNMAREEERDDDAGDRLDDDGYDDDLDFDYGIFGDAGQVSVEKPFVNGTGSLGVSDEGIFED